VINTVGSKVTQQTSQTITNVPIVECQTYSINPEVLTFVIVWDVC